MMFAARARVDKRFLPTAQSLGACGNSRGPLLSRFDQPVERAVPQEIEFLYDFGSPNAYLVEMVLPEIAKRHGLTIRHTPILLGGLFKITGNLPPMVRFHEVPSKINYMRIEMDRFIKRHDIAFQWNPKFPILTTALMRGAIYAQGKPWETDYRAAVYRHCWVLGTDMNDPDTILNVLRADGLPAAEILGATQDPKIKAALFTATQTAMDRHVFGIPTMFFEGQMYFGKDSLIDLEHALAQKTPG